MAEQVAEILGWLNPELVVFGITALLIAILAWGVHRARRSPRARAAANQVRSSAGAALVRLDDAVDELEVEVGLSGALYGGGAPASLRRARLNAQHVRDQSFEEFRAITGDTVSPVEVRRVAQRIERRTTEALAAIGRARTEHREWVRANVSAAEQVVAAQERLDALRASMGDPAALVAELSKSYDEVEWASASRAAHNAVTEAAEAARLLERAASLSQDPTQSALAELAGAERALRAAEADARNLEESHRLVTQAASGLASEFESARQALRQALAVREQLEPREAERLGGELRAFEAELTNLERDAARRPTRTIDAIARLRDRLDIALGDARTSQQRLRGARTALPSTLAAARSAIAQAEAAVAHANAGVEARVRLVSAQRELAAARQQQDPVEALDAARRAIRHAEDATALADYAGLT
jgi:hypothetical protein